jgi:GT2 family glycosyltransferase
VVVTHNGLVFTRLCLESVLASIGIANLEVIIVDNGSADGTHEYLHRLAERDSRFCLIRNDRNLGFAAAVNMGLAAARGDMLVALNNDTIVPPNALHRLLDHLEDRTVGLIGPVSNEASTEAEIDVSYRTYGELIGAAEERARSHAGIMLDVPVLTMFCIAFRRDFWECIGPLDERFEIGLFEDDDYCVRARNAGYGVVCAEDVLVHHFGEASLGALVPTGEHARLFEANRGRFEEKWGLRWRPHGRRQTNDYRDSIERIRETVRGTVPAGARVLVSTPVTTRPTATKRSPNSRSKRPRALNSWSSQGHRCGGSTITATFVPTWSKAGRWRVPTHVSYTASDQTL